MKMCYLIFIYFIMELIIHCNHCKKIIFYNIRILEYKCQDNYVLHQLEE